MSTTADRPAHDTIDGAVTVDAPATGTRPPDVSSLDRFMRRLLILPEGKTATAAEARTAFQKSLLVSTARCLLMYIIFPFVLPAVGIARGVGPWVGLVIGVLAIISIVFSIRRFWRADHSKRWHYTIFGSAIIGFLIYLAVKDGSALFG
jgi:ABC-type iron transport system FetAB permease component